jgi:hypothetical protein
VCWPFLAMKGYQPPPRWPAPRSGRGRASFTLM